MTEPSAAVPSGSEAQRGRRLTGVTAALLVAAAVVAYHNSFSGAFVFDDFPAVRDNPTIRSLWPPTTALSPPSDTGVGGRPLTNLSFALNYAIGGTDVRGYHALNLLLHAGSALLLFGIVRRVAAGVPACRGPVRQAGTPAATNFAFAAALLWVVHPLTTASVTYLSQRSEVLMGFFYLLTVYAFARATAFHVIRENRLWLALSVLACALGMMSKEVMVTAPVLVLLYDRTFVAGAFRAALRLRWRYHLALAATWLILGYLLTTGLSQRSVGYGLGVSATEYALTQARSVLLYLKLAFWPSPLVFDYGPVYGVSVVAVAMVLVVLGFVAFALWRWPRAGFVAGCFFLLLAPTSSVVPVAEQPMAENRMYLPLAAVLVLLAAGVGAMRGGRSLPYVVPAALALGVLTVQRNEDFRSELALWADTVAKRGNNGRAHFNYGVNLLHAGRASDAAGHFEAAARLRPRDAEAQHSLGNALLELGRIDDAIAHYDEALRLRPDYPRAWHNYGLALLRRGDTAGAIERFARAVQLQPDFAAAQYSLGNAYFQRDEPALAIRHYQEVLRLEPGHVDAHYSCGSACFELGRLEEAIAHFAAAARLKPADPEIRNFHGAALLKAGRRAEAIAQFEEALRIKPDYADARENLAIARAGR